MTEKSIQSLETAMENIAHEIEIETNRCNADYKAIMSRVHAMERMNKLIPEDHGREDVELVSIPDHFFNPLPECEQEEG